MKIRGKVEKVTQLEKNAFITVLGTDYSRFGQCPYQEGDEIEFEVVVNGQYKNMKNDKLAEGAQAVRTKDTATLGTLKSMDESLDVIARELYWKNRGEYP